MCQSLANRVVFVSAFNSSSFRSQTIHEPCTFFFCQPLCIGRFVCQVVEGYDTKEYGRNTFYEEQPTPTGIPHNAVEGGNEEAREQGTEDQSNRLSEVEAGKSACTIFVREPFADEVNNARIETSFRSTK